MALTDVHLRRAKPKDRPYRLTDGAGLHLFVTPAGSRIWRYRYEFAGKERLLVIGPYPDVGLAEAREARDDAKRSLRSGLDPMTVKRQRKMRAADGQVDTFRKIAMDWHAIQSPNWVDRHADDVKRSLEHEVFPTLGDIPIADIEPPEVLALLRTIEGRGSKETARRVRQRMSGVFVFGIGAGKCTTDPAAIVLKAMAPVVKRRLPAITDLDKARQILRDVDEAPGHPGTKLAMRLLALTVLRPGPLVETPFAELPPLDGETPVWQVSAERMKLRKHLKDDAAYDHLIPLSRQAIETIVAARTLSKRSAFLFPNTRSSQKPLSENALGYALNRAGYHHRHVPHGWRTTFSTVMNEAYPADRFVIDFMLAHVPKDETESAYNRAKYLRRRAELAQIWADLITTTLRPAGDLLSMPRR